MLGFSAGKVRDEIGERGAETPSGGTWRWAAVARWPWVHPLSASHHLLESFTMPVPAACLSVLLLLLGVLTS